MIKKTLLARLLTSRGHTFRDLPRTFRALPPNTLCPIRFGEPSANLPRASTGRASAEHAADGDNCGQFLCEESLFGEFESNNS